MSAALLEGARALCEIIFILVCVLASCGAVHWFSSLKKVNRRVKRLPSPDRTAVRRLRAEHDPDWTVSRSSH